MPPGSLRSFSGGTMPARTATEAEFQAWETRLEAGENPAKAARDGSADLTCGSFKRGDRVRYDDALSTSREARGLYVVEKLEENVERAMEARPVLDREGNETGVFDYDGAVANKALELLGRSAGLFVERKEIEISGREGGPIELEGHAIVGLADVVAFARSIGASDSLRLDAGDSRPALPAAEEVRPDPPGDLDAASVLPAARQS